MVGTTYGDARKPIIRWFQVQVLVALQIKSVDRDGPDLHKSLLH
jgi:hypothetical protein